MRNKLRLCAATLLLAGAGSLAAQDIPLPTGSVYFNLPKDSPVALLSMVSDQSRATARGAALVLDLHMAVTLRNSSANRIRGITLRVVSQEVALGGKGSVTIPSLNIGPGQVFPVRIDMQLMRPGSMGVQAAAGPLVQVDLDGVLFQDLSFFGPNRLHSRRYLTACEMEARRDREYFKRVLAQSGRKGLQDAMLESLARQASLPPLTVKVWRGGPAVSTAAVAPEHTAKFAFLQVPDSPVVPIQGWAEIAGNEARAPRIEVRNTSTRPVKYVELGWVVSDSAGRQYMAASVPSADPELYLPPGKTARILQETALNFSSLGRPVNVKQMTGFVKEVEFADGRMWVPSRQSIANPLLEKVLAPSAEEQRLSDIYRRKGIEALISELKNY